ncbi:MAG: DUF3883 domain-containing protein [Candidatus Pacebacteria bacterium]|nr:DUF3883 domain-containing protein [Candidatus Paceibacterota bacterium]
MEIEELRIKQAEFEVARQEFKAEITRLESERKKFLSLFSETELKNLKVEDFVIGKNSEDTFCYWLENRLKGLGNIHGATALKFGIYYGKTKSDPTIKYRFTSRFGKNENEAFQKVKSAIFSLLHSAKNNNLDEIKENLLSPMFKGKILSTYFPDRFLNIFAKEHLDYFLDKLDISYSDSLDEIEKRDLLMQFKIKDVVMKSWSVYEFSKFLYEKFGRPAREEEIPEELKEYMVLKYPFLNKVKADFVDLTIVEIPEKQGKDTKSILSKKIDFEKENKVNKKIGERGELVVFKKEKEYLESIGKKELSMLVQHISRDDDSAGYDILSFDESENKKYIEVKSTKQKVANANFLISSNEYNKAKNLPNYYVYIVFETNTTNPKICKLKKPFELPPTKIKVTPISYRVLINLK